MATKSRTLEIAEEIIRLRLAQMIVNEHYKSGDFKIPIHLALGHEALAVAVSQAMTGQDKLVLSHRNIHYNLAREDSLKALLDEYLLKPEGIGQGRLGSMNLANVGAGIEYSSSILGNNLSVATGIALGHKVCDSGVVTFVVTGDGAIEEGAFYESLCFMRSHNLSVVIIVENNDWSLGTRIDERRGELDLGALGSALDIGVVSLQDNDPVDYMEKIAESRERAGETLTPVIVEVALATLGDWRLKTDDYPEGKYINYHAGPAPTVDLSSGSVLHEDERDPVYVLRQHVSSTDLESITATLLERLLSEAAESLAV